MVFWEKSNAEDLESEILLEKSKGLRDQECYNCNSLKIILTFYSFLDIHFVPVIGDTHLQDIRYRGKI